jgi:hypothetical protein
MDVPTILPSLDAGSVEDRMSQLVDGFFAMICHVYSLCSPS